MPCSSNDNKQVWTLTSFSLVLSLEENQKLESFPYFTAGKIGPEEQEHACSPEGPKAKPGQEANTPAYKPSRSPWRLHTPTP